MTQLNALNLKTDSNKEHTIIQHFEQLVNIVGDDEELMHFFIINCAMTLHAYLEAHDLYKAILGNTKMALAFEKTQLTKEQLNEAQANPKATRH